MGRLDSIFGQFGETVRCRDANFFVSNITSKPLNRFAWNFLGRCGVTIGRPDYIFGQFRETAQCRDAQHGDGFVVLSHHSLFFTFSFLWPSWYRLKPIIPWGRRLSVLVHEKAHSCLSYFIKYPLEGIYTTFIHRFLIQTVLATYHSMRISTSYCRRSALFWELFYFNMNLDLLFLFYMFCHSQLWQQKRAWWL